MKIFLATALISIFSGVASAKGYQCHGTEPFWGLKLGSDEIIFTSMEGDTQVFMPTEAQQPRGMSSDGPVQIFQTWNAVNATASLLAVVRTGECSDYMSDELYPYSVFVAKDDRAGSEFLTGCCILVD